MDGFSFQPAAAAGGDRYPAWVILHREAHFGDNEGRNATTAEAMTSTGHTVGVTFHLAHPPAVSYFCVHGPKLGREDFDRVPEVVSCEKDLVLLRVALASGPRVRSGTDGYPDRPLDEYFLYKAGAGRGKATLSLILAPRTEWTQSICILPRDDVEGEFLLADFVGTNSIIEYELHVFSSETSDWSNRGRLQLEKSPDTHYDDVPMAIDKVMALGGGVVGLVDMCRGIMVCNVLDKDPVLHFIPLPNAEFDKRRRAATSRIRNVVVCDGFIKFVEVDCRFRQERGINKQEKKCKKMTNDLDNTDIIYDSEILIHDCYRVEPMPVPDGWKIRTCYRHTSWDYWRKGHIVDVDDLHDSLPELSDGSAGKWAFKDMATAYPALSIVPGDDVVYLMSKVDSDDTKAWMIGLHLREKTLEIRKPYSASYFRCPVFLPCAFSGYLNETSNQVSA